MHVSPLGRRTRRAAVALTLVATLGVAGCGGGSSSSKKDYYSAINTFCQNVKTAAGKVQTDATKLQSSIASNPQKAIKGFAGTLDTFANDTQSALTTFQKTDVPGDYKDFNTKAVAAFEGVITKLHTAATGAASGKVQALANLGTDLNSVKLPDLPKDVASNAKNCADISGSSK